MKKVLTVRLSAGLCNRLRALLSAICFCEATNRHLLIYWAPVFLQNVPLGSLFTHDFKEIGPRTHDFLKKVAYYLGMFYTYKQVHLGITSPLIVVDTTEVFPCVEPFPFPLARYMAHLTPILQIQEQIQAFYSQHFAGQKIVGVSIRYKKATPEAIAHSPPEWFVQRINEISRCHPSVKVFLSADCKEVSDYIRSKVRVQLLEMHKTFAFNECAGVQEAVCDLYLLSFSNYIVGPYWSSFKDMAIGMRGEVAFEDSMDSSHVALLPEYLGRALPNTVYPNWLRRRTTR